MVVHDPTCMGIISRKTRVLVIALPTWVVLIHKSQSKAWGSPGKELTKINGLILKGEMGDSSSFHHA
jgi:hypothetical protein